MKTQDIFHRLDVMKTKLNFAGPTESRNAQLQLANLVLRSYFDMSEVSGEPGKWVVSLSISCPPGPLEEDKRLAVFTVVGEHEDFEEAKELCYREAHNFFATLLKDLFAESWRLWRCRSWRLIRASPKRRKE